jgi:hypothetical protein
MHHQLAQLRRTHAQVAGQTAVVVSQVATSWRSTGIILKRCGTYGGKRTKSQIRKKTQRVKSLHAFAQRVKSLHAFFRKRHKESRVYILSHKESRVYMLFLGKDIPKRKFVDKRSKLRNARKTQSRLERGAIVATDTCTEELSVHTTYIQHDATSLLGAARAAGGCGAGFGRWIARLGSNASSRRTRRGRAATARRLDEKSATRQGYWVRREPPTDSGPDLDGG